MSKMEKLQKLLAEIPKGKITTYKILAEKMGSGPREVGWLLSKNPFPRKYPCYKVVNSDGRVGGYTGGVQKKTSLLEKDGIEITNGRIDIERYCHRF